MKRLLAVLCFALVGASCQDAQTVVPNPVAPSLGRPPTTPLYPPESWTLTAMVTSVTPHPCWRDLTGLTYEYKLTVRRAEPMRLLVYWDPTDGIEYVGSLSGQDFSGAGRFNNGNSFSLGCASGGPVGVILTGRVSGHFSDDGRFMSAEEVISYLVVGTGEQVDVRYRWAATAPAE
jgi:hypothetical protein